MNATANDPSLHIDLITSGPGTRLEREQFSTGISKFRLVEEREYRAADLVGLREAIR